MKKQNQKNNGADFLDAQGFSKNSWHKSEKLFWEETELDEPELEPKDDYDEDEIFLYLD